MGPLALAAVAEARGEVSEFCAALRRPFTGSGPVTPVRPDASPEERAHELELHLFEVGCDQSVYRDRTLSRRLGHHALLAGLLTAHPDPESAKGDRRNMLAVQALGLVRMRGINRDHFNGAVDEAALVAAFGADAWSAHVAVSRARADRDFEVATYGGELPAWYAGREMGE